MSEIEILQQSFMDSMNSMQKSFDKEKKQKVGNFTKSNSIIICLKK